MALGRLHRSIDRFAMWLEDRALREPEPFRAAPAGPLDCFGALPRPPPGPERPGPWSAPSPRPLHPGDQMSVTWFPAVGKARGTALLVPPWKTGGVGLVRGWIDVLAQAGRDVWLVVPPHHLERTPAGARSGEAFVSPDLVRLRSTFEQLVLEVRMAAALAARRGPVDLVGLSLGALASALAATAAPELQRAVLVAPPADLAAVVAETPIGRRYRSLAERAGAPFPPAEALREALGAFDPSRLPRPAGEVLVGVGRHDAIALPGAALALARAWDAAVSVHPRGHLTLLFACRALRRDVVRLLGRDPASAAPRGARLGGGGPA